MTRFLPVSFGLLFCYHLGCQTHDSTRVIEDYRFILHLASQKMFGEAEMELGAFRREAVFPAYVDSASYFLGRQFELTGRPEDARRLFMQVSENTSLYYPARYRAISLVAERNAPIALHEAMAIEPSTSEVLNELKLFEVGGIALLNSNYRIFDSIASNTFQVDLLKEEMANLRAYRNQLGTLRRKSAFLAGALSAVVPGLGKVYVGNNGQALSSFLTCALMGGIAFENYRNMGPVHPQTIFFGALFGVFYIGNIWGSAVSVQLVKTEKELENKHNILVAVRVPIDRFFN